MSSIVFGVLAAVTGIWLALREGIEYVRAWQSRRWPTHQATIVESAVLVVSIAGWRVGPRLAASGILRYTYEVPDRYARRGHTREGRRFRFGPVPLRTIGSFLRAHPAGSVVPVAVNPHNFDDAVLIPGPTALGTLALIGALLMLVGGIAWLGFAVMALTS